MALMKNMQKDNGCRAAGWKLRVFIARLLCLFLLCGMMPLRAAAAGMPFADVNAGHWFYEYVEYVYEQGLMSGTAQDRFSPQMSTTRAMTVTILYRMDGSPDTENRPFRDVPDNTWYTEAVGWAAEWNIVGGYGNGRFGPDDPVTREQLAKILAGYAGYQGYGVSEEDFQNAGLEQFSDRGRISDWAEPYVCWAVNQGLLNGKGDGILDPGGLATRAEIAALFTRFCQMYQDDEEEDYEIIYDLWENADLVVPEDTEICMDSSEPVFYASDILLVLMDPEAEPMDILEAAEAVSGTPVGYAAGLDLYQFRVPVSSRTELEKMGQDLMDQFSFVRYATYDSAGPAAAEATDVPPAAVNDPWNGDVNAADWKDDDVDGSNWAMEAIDAPHAWAWADSLEHVAAGVSDTSFYTEHEDLRGRCAFASEELESYNDTEESSAHGTSVAGVIGANPNNHTGLTGVAWNADLVLAPYAHGYNSRAGEHLEWDSITYSNLAALVDYGAKVINFSQGKTNFLDKDHRSFSKDMIRREGDLAAAAVARLLEGGYDFLVVQASGNGIDISDGKDGSKKIPADALQNGWFCSITKDSDTASDVITADDVLSRVIIVGAAEMRNPDKNGEKRSAGLFRIAAASNYGEQVTLCAPGVLVSWLNEDGSGYITTGGTSIAAPIVTGVCATVWGAQEDLTAPAVKDLVCSCTDLDIQPHPDSPWKKTTGMVNALLPIEEAFAVSDVMIYLTDEKNNLITMAEVEFRSDNCVYHAEMEQMAHGFGYLARLPRSRTYQVSVNVDWFEPFSTSITPVSLGFEKFYQLKSLERYLTGTVRESGTGTPLEEVYITWYGKNYYDSDETDEKGAYRSDFLRPGDYTAVYEKDGYESQSIDFHVSDADRIIRFKDVYLKKDLSLSPEEALEYYLPAACREEGVMDTYTISGIRDSSAGGFRPGWDADDLNGALTADIRDYDGDGVPEMLLTGYSASGKKVSLWMSVYEYNASNGSVARKAKKTVETNTPLLSTAIASDQVNTFTYKNDGKQIIAVDVREHENGMHRSLSLFEYNGSSIRCTGGLGIMLPGTGGAHIMERVAEKEAPLFGDLVYAATAASPGWTEKNKWKVLPDYEYSGSYAEYLEDMELTKTGFRDMVSARYGLVINPSNEWNREKTAEDVYRAASGDIAFLSMVQNYYSLTGSGAESWKLLRRDLPGALDAYR